MKIKLTQHRINPVFVSVMILFINFLGAEKIEDFVNNHPGLNQKQKHFIQNRFFYFSDHVFLTEKLTAETTELYTDVVDVVILEDGTNETIAKSLYFTFLSRNQNLNKKEIFQLVIPLSFSKIKPHVFLEYLNYYSYLKHTGVKEKQATAQIFYLNENKTTPGQLHSMKPVVQQLQKYQQGKFLTDYFLLKKSKLNFQSGDQFINWIKTPSGAEFKKLKQHLTQNYSENYSRDVIESIVNSSPDEKSLQYAGRKILESEKQKIPPDMVIQELRKKQSKANVSQNSPNSIQITSGQDVKKNLMIIIKSFLGTPYRWGGSTRNGTDCSGLTQSISAELGIKIPRTAHGQAKSGYPVTKQNLQFGDLVFFATSGGRRITLIWRLDF